MSISAIRNALRTVATTRAALAATSAEVKAKRAAFEVTYATELATEKAQKATVDEAEAAARALILAHYEATSEKKPVPGGEVKVYKTMSVLDGAAALAWAQQTKIALIPESVDEKALLAIAAATKLPFVLYGEEPQATLAKNIDLTKLVEPEPEAASV